MQVQGCCEVELEARADDRTMNVRVQLFAIIVDDLAVKTRMYEERETMYDASKTQLITDNTSKTTD